MGIAPLTTLLHRPGPPKKKEPEPSDNDLSHLQNLIIQILAKANGEPVTRKQIYEEVYELSFDPKTNRIDAQICRIRAMGYNIRTHRRKGYSYLPNIQPTET